MLLALSMGLTPVNMLVRCVWLLMFGPCCCWQVNAAWPDASHIPKTSDARVKREEGRSAREDGWMDAWMDVWMTDCAERLKIDAE